MEINDLFIPVKSSDYLLHGFGPVSKPLVDDYCLVANGPGDLTKVMKCVFTKDLDKIGIPIQFADKKVGLVQFESVVISTEVWIQAWSGANTRGINGQGNDYDWYSDTWTAPINLPLFSEARAVKVVSSTTYPWGWAGGNGHVYAAVLYDDGRVFTWGACPSTGRNNCKVTPTPIVDENGEDPITDAINIFGVYGLLYIKRADKTLWVVRNDTDFSRDYILNVTHGFRWDHIGVGDDYGAWPIRQVLIAEEVVDVAVVHRWDYPDDQIINRGISYFVGVSGTVYRCGFLNALEGGPSIISTPVVFGGFDAGITSIGVSDRYAHAIDVNGYIWAWGEDYKNDENAVAGALGWGGPWGQPFPHLYYTPFKLLNTKDVRFIRRNPQGAVGKEGSILAWGETIITPRISTSRFLEPGSGLADLDRVDPHSGVQITGLRSLRRDTSFPVSGNLANWNVTKISSGGATIIVKEDLPDPEEVPGWPPSTRYVRATQSYHSIWNLYRLVIVSDAWLYYVFPFTDWIDVGGVHLKVHDVKSGGTGYPTMPENPWKFHWQSNAWGDPKKWYFTLRVVDTIGELHDWYDTGISDNFKWVNAKITDNPCIGLNPEGGAQEDPIYSWEAVYDCQDKVWTPVRLVSAGSDSTTSPGGGWEWMGYGDRGLWYWNVTDNCTPPDLPAAPTCYVHWTAECWGGTWLISMMYIEPTGTYSDWDCWGDPPQYCTCVTNSTSPPAPPGGSSECEDPYGGYYW